MTDDLILSDVDSLAASIPDGAMVAIPREIAGCAMAAVRALVRRRARNLHLLAVPTSSLEADLLIGAGAVAVMESAGVSMGEHGQAPCFGRAVREGRIRLKDATCPAVHAALQAGAKGIPFMPLRGLIGSDLVRHRDDYKVIDSPFGEDDPIVAIKAVRPDVALFHAPLADRYGNVWIGAQRELMIMAHAARATYVTVEAFHDGDLLRDDRLAAATIPAVYISGVAEARNGAWPLSLPGRYERDDEHLALYVRQAATEEGLQAYLAEHVTGVRAAAE